MKLTIHFHGPKHQYFNKVVKHNCLPRVGDIIYVKLDESKDDNDDDNCYKVEQVFHDCSKKPSETSLIVVQA